MRKSERAGESSPGLEQVSKLLTDLYIPLAEVQRDIPWPNGETTENDAEHSYSLALIGSALGERHGMNPGLIALYALMHDIHERYAGDTSFWDDNGRKTKHQRETEASSIVIINFQETPIIASILSAYQMQIDEESQFVYALDKLLATMMVVNDNGRNWKNRGLTFEEYASRAHEKLRSQIATHPLVLKWYDELWREIEARKEVLFVSTIVEEVPTI